MDEKELKEKIKLVKERIDSDEKELHDFCIELLKYKTGLSVGEIVKQSSSDERFKITKILIDFEEENKVEYSLKGLKLLRDGSLQSFITFVETITLPLD